MWKIYKKSELLFSLVFIVLYVVLFSFSDFLSVKIGAEKSVTSISGVVLSFLIILFIRKNSLLNKYGLCRIQNSSLNISDVVFFLFIVSANLWNGLAVNLSVIETLFYIISMLCVGLIEEIIFRGFLFKALCKDSVKTAVIISSVTFGAGHIINLLNSADFIGTLLQICYASAIGFAFTIFFLKKGSLWPCIAVHSIFNSLSVFANETDGLHQVLISVILTVVPVIYAVSLIKKSDKIIDN